MKTYYEQVLELVNQNKLTIDLMLSLQRSMSTVTEKALLQSPEVDGQISEAFAGYQTEIGNPKKMYGIAKIVYGKGSKGQNFALREAKFQNSCQRILNKYNEITCKQPEKNTITLIVVDRPGESTPEEFNKILELSRNVIITIRDPRLQGASMITRYATDRFNEIALASFPIIGSDGYTDREIFAILRGENKHIKIPNTSQTMAISADQLKAIKELIASEINKSWESLIPMVNDVRNHFSTRDTKLPGKLVIMEGEELRLFPEKQLLALTHNIDGIPYTPKMLSFAKGQDDWSCTYTGPGGILQDFARTNTFSGPARTSIGFFSPQEYRSRGGLSQKAQEIEFPQELKPVLLNALNIYRTLQSAKEYISSLVKIDATDLPVPPSILYSSMN